MQHKQCKQSWYSNYIVIAPTPSYRPNSSPQSNHCLPRDKEVQLFSVISLINISQREENLKGLFIYYILPFRLFLTPVRLCRPLA